MFTQPSSSRITVDPVCGMAVNSDVSKITSTFEGKTYYFCADGCRRSFEKEPCNYLFPRRKGIWGRYVDRLQKATGRKGMRCH